MITIYSLPTCGNCKQLKKLLEEKNIPFLNIDDRDTVIARGIKSVPTLELEDGTQMSFGDAYRWAQAQEGSNP